MTAKLVEHKLRSQPVMIVAAHQDDETIGLGLRLGGFRRLRAIVHVTDGAARNLGDIERAGADTWQEYAALRRRELDAAIQEAGALPFRKICLWCPDPQAVYRMRRNANRLAGLFLRFRPRYVLTHSYEGGHPDHDSIAAAVQLAIKQLRSRRIRPPVIVEF